jgi:hypothetical protein
LRVAERRDIEEARAFVDRAKARHDAAMTAELSGRLALDQSDDLRLYTALLASELDRTAKLVESAAQAAG